MPEIWLNYGTTEVVLELMAENLEQTLDSGGLDGGGMAQNAPLPDGSPPDAQPFSGGSGRSGDDNDNDNGNDFDTRSNPDSGHSGGDSGNADVMPTPGAKSPGDADDADDNDNAANTDAANAVLGAGAPAKAPDAGNSADSDGADTHASCDATAGAPAETIMAGSRRPARVGKPAPTLDSEKISAILGELDLAGPFDLVILHDSQAVRRVVSSLFVLCEQRSLPPPGILADRDMLPSIRPGLPEGGVAAEFSAGLVGGGTPAADHAIIGARPLQGDADTASLDAPRDHGDGKRRGLVFVAETEFDGLFGYETVSTRLLRRLGSGGDMLAAYAKRDGNMPSPGRRTGSFAEAAKFSDGFEIGGIDIVANAGGISDIFVGHPSKTADRASACLESRGHILDVERQKTVFASTGKPSSSATLGSALSTAWNCHRAVRDGGLFVLAAECSQGLGPDALRMRIEGALRPEHLPNPSAYVDGMEQLLFLQEVQKRCQIALVSVLPELYTKRLGLVSLEGMKASVQYMQKTQGARQKASVIVDGSRLLLR